MVRAVNQINQYSLPVINTKNERMKQLKKIVFAGLVLFVHPGLSAQKSPLGVGVKAGYNLSGAIVNDATSTSTKAGYHIGATVEYTFSKNFLIQSGLFFSTKGAEIYQLNASSYIVIFLHQSTIRIHLKLLI